MSNLFGILQKVRELPRWVGFLFITMQILFLISAVELTTHRFSDISVLNSELRGVKSATRVNQFLELFAVFTLDCNLSRLSPQNQSKQATDCERATEKVHGLTHHLLDDAQLRLWARASDLSVTPDQFFSVTTLLNQQILQELSAIYRDSLMELDPRSETYSLGRLLIMTLPMLHDRVAAMEHALVQTLEGYRRHSDFDRDWGQISFLLDESKRLLSFLLTSDEGTILLDSQEPYAIAELAEVLNEFYERASLLMLDTSTTELQAQFSDSKLWLISSSVREELSGLRVRVSQDLQIRLESLIDDQWRLLLITGAAMLLVQIVLLVMFRYLVSVYWSLSIALQEAQLASERVTRAKLEQERLFSIVGHELRTPAASISMLLDDLASGSSGPERLAEAQRTSEHLLSVLDDMRMASDGALSVDSQVTEFNLYQVVQDALGTLSHLTQSDKIELRLSLQINPDRVVVGPQRVVRQIVINLVKNAFIHSGADVVDVQLTESGYKEGLGQYSLRVEDSGAGIGVESVSELFSAFQRGDTTADGTGLGLYISRELARNLLKGDVSYLPRTGGGSVFQFDFQLKAVAPSQRVDTPSTQASVIAGKRILFVEDTATLRILGAKVLEKAGARVLVAEQGADALDLIATNDIDLVLTDIMMPVMDGYELCRSLRERGFRAPIIGVTGATVGDEASMLLTAGADAVLAKPLKLAKLESLVSQLASTDDRQSS